MITTDDIQGLRTAAATAGDHAMVLICDLHTGDVDIADTGIETLRIAAFLSPADVRRIGAMDSTDLEEAVVEAIQAGRASAEPESCCDRTCSGGCGRTECECADRSYEASLTEALVWAADAVVGDYLVQYEDTGMTDAEDPGSRCGYDDAELDAIRDALDERGLNLITDDRGLLCGGRQEHGYEPTDGEVRE